MCYTSWIFCLWLRFLFTIYTVEYSHQFVLFCTSTLKPLDDPMLAIPMVMYHYYYYCC